MVSQNGRVVCPTAEYHFSDSTHIRLVQACYVFFYISERAFVERSAPGGSVLMLKAPNDGRREMFEMFSNSVSVLPTGKPVGILGRKKGI